MSYFGAGGGVCNSFVLAVTGQLELKCACMEEFLTFIDKELCCTSLPKPDSPRGRDQQR